MNVVLVVAEDHGLRESLKAALPSTDLMLFERSLEEAVRRLISIKADVAVVDDTPRLGMAALRRLQDTAPEMPVIVLCARGDSDTIATYTMAGARQCLAKPYSCDQLCETIAQVLANENDVSGAEPDTPAITPAPSLNQHQTALRWMQRTTSHIRDQDRISESLMDCLTDVFDVVRGAVLLDFGGYVAVAASHGLLPVVAEAIRFELTSGLMRWFEAHRCLMDRRRLAEGSQPAKELQVLGGRMAAPLICSGRLHGAIVLGEKASGQEYSQEECELLTALARYASISFENARLYEDVTRQQSRLDTILANVTAGVVTIAPDKVVTLMNQSAERLLQVRQADIVGRSVQKLGSAFADVVLRTLNDGKPRLRQEVRDPAINATLGLSVTPLGSEGAVVMFSKLPKERASDEEIEYSPLWEYLASRVAQEIKNPMVAINTYAQLLPRKYESADFRDSFGEVVQKEIGRINEVVENLFEFARNPRLSVQTGSLNETVQSVVESFEQDLRARKIEIDVELDPAMPSVELDPIFLAQALHNLIQNAMEAMTDGGRVTVRTVHEDEHCAVMVEDTGPGIAEQDAPHIFTPFFSTKEQGMGLGLTMAQRIARQHRGELALMPSNTGGCAFAVRLPVAGAVYANHTSH